MLATDVRVESIEPGFSIAALRGAHDIASAGVLRERLSELVSRGDSIVVDLSSASFVDSSVLSVLVGTYKVTRECGLGFAVLLDEATPAPVRRAFETTGLMSLFWIVEDRADAVDAARRGRAPQLVV
jgi:anti-anti-sigma factor